MFLVVNKQKKNSCAFLPEKIIKNDN